ncbi:MAG: sulfate adenylyltransferase [Gemmatimonadota bacterium]|jgi:sulfate adenylyltransferase
MAQLVRPHGADGRLKPRLLEGKQLEEARSKAETLRKIPMTSREVGDAIMMGIGGFTPLEGFMGHDDWKGCVTDFQMADGTFWPIPVTFSVSEEVAGLLKEGDEVALVDPDEGATMAILTVREKYTIDKELECREVFRTTDLEHPGVAKVMDQLPVNVGGPIQVLSEGMFPHEFAGIYQRPAEARHIFEQRGWNTVAALQLRNPMHNSHAYLAKVAIEVTDGVYIHQLLGALKPGDIPAETRVKCIDALVQNYFRPERVVQGGYPLDMRYAGPREALLHAVFRQNYGCSHLIVGRDHAGVGDYYGPFDAHEIFNEVPPGALLTQPLKMDWTFYCYQCGEMASMKTCPHEEKAVLDEEGNHVSGDRLLLSGTMLRKMLSEGKAVPKEFSKPEVVALLREFYAGLEEKVEVKLHGAATGAAAEK